MNEAYQVLLSIADTFYEIPAVSIESIISFILQLN